jgi:predicted acetyltransferase
MKLVFPNKEYEAKAKEFIAEFYEYDSEIAGSGSLDRYLKESTYDEWLTKVFTYIDIANLPADKIPGLTYFFVREEDDRIVGMINIRLALNDFLRNEAGHIGYCIRPTERRKGYGTQLLRAGIAVCRRVDIENIIVTCDKVNLGSAGVIQNCGGVLEAELYSEAFGEVIQRYVIGAEKC